MLLLLIGKHCADGQQSVGLAELTEKPRFGSFFDCTELFWETEWFENVQRLTEMVRMILFTGIFAIGAF